MQEQLFLTTKNLLKMKQLLGWQIRLQTQLAVVPTFDGYTYTGALIERDTATEIDGSSHDMQYGGNEKTRVQASKFWNGLLITGTRVRKELKEFVRDLINNYILTQGVNQLNRVCGYNTKL